MRGVDVWHHVSFGISIRDAVCDEIDLVWLVKLGSACETVVINSDIPTDCRVDEKGLGLVV